MEGGRTEPWKDKKEEPRLSPSSLWPVKWKQEAKDAGFGVRVQILVSIYLTSLLLNFSKLHLPICKQYGAKEVLERDWHTVGNQSTVAVILTRVGANPCLPGKSGHLWSPAFSPDPGGLFCAENRPAWIARIFPLRQPF